MITSSKKKALRKENGDQHLSRSLLGILLIIFVNSFECRLPKLGLPLQADKERHCARRGDGCAPTIPSAPLLTPHAIHNLAEVLLHYSSQHDY